MALTRERKEELVAEYSDMLVRSKGFIITEYRGLDNQAMTKLRREVSRAGGAYRVTKMTMFKRALEASGLPVPDELFDAPVALGFCYEEVPAVAKALADFADESDWMVVRGALLGDQFLSAAQVEAIADLPPLDVLRSQLLGLLSAPASGLAGVINAGVAQVINVIAAYAEQGEGAAAPAE